MVPFTRAINRRVSNTKLLCLNCHCDHCTYHAREKNINVLLKVISGDVLVCISALPILKFALCVLFFVVEGMFSVLSFFEGMSSALLFYSSYSYKIW